MPVVCDTQEQRPWQFPADEFTTVRRKLRTADYSLTGMEDVVGIERKSLGDFVGTVIHDWIRFRKELVRFSGFDLACVVVEADVGDVLAHRYESDADPASVIGKANAIFCDHGIPVLWWGRPEQAADLAARFLRLAWRKYQYAVTDAF